MTETLSAKQWLLFIAAPVLLVFHAFYYYPFMVDDAFISLRYAERLLHGHGLTWNDGEVVEGYSDLLWVLLNAGLGYMGFQLEASARVLGLASAILTLSAFFWHSREAKLSEWPQLAGIAIFIIAPPVAIWAMAGLEACMVMLLFTWAIVLCYRLLDEEKLPHAYCAAAALALIILLRPEGPLYAIAIALALLLHSVLPFARRLRMAALICFLPLLFFCAQLAFRLDVYGQWLPNTVLVKVAFSLEHLFHGFMYTVKGLISFLPVFIYVGFNYCSARSKGGNETAMRFIEFLFTVFSFLAMSIFLAGGDIFFGFRAFVPLVPLLALMVMHALALGARHISIKKEAVFFLPVLAGYIWSQFAIDVNHIRGTGHQWELDAKAIGLSLKDKYGDKQLLIAVHAAGAVPFYSELPSLDIYGLNDISLARRRHEQKRFGKQLSGHELFDGEYVESKKPDILVFDIPGLPPLCVDDFLKECDILLPHYRPEILHIPGHDVTIWVRKDSERLK